MMKHLLSLCLAALAFSCTSTVNTDRYSLEGTDKVLSFPIMEEVKVPQSSVFLFSEKGKDYLSFQNMPKSEILIYSMDSQSLVKRLLINAEGDNSVVGGFGGYYIADMEHIFIPSVYISTIFAVDTVGNVKQKINYAETKEGQQLKPFMPSDQSQMVFIDKDLYIPQTMNLRLGNEAIEKSPVKVVLDTIENTAEALPMRFPPLIDYKDFGTVSAFGADYSCCYNGNSFIYSFYADEDLYITSPAHEKIEKKKAKSKYIDGVTVFRSNEDDFQKMIKAQCEQASYGKILYDKYRDVYYRFAYPPCEINDYSGDYVELLRSGRKSFSIMILDNQLNVIGETSFPAYTYNSNLSFILEDGLYVSLNHIKNPDYSDDVLRFQKLELKEIRK
ncbi:DUF4221 family protein [Bacteroides sp.]|uniref:DUF4221 family protein n=1 Tax=Bacteroides sp. TaxID=29523 RepID=UPI003AB6C8A1